MLNRKQLFLSLSLVWLCPGQGIADAPDSKAGKRADTVQAGRSAPGLHGDLSLYASNFYTTGGADYTKSIADQTDTYYGSTPGAREVDPLEVAHHDSSLLRRLSRLKSLSLVTFMRTDKTRVFLGVTKEGHPGIYFATQPKHLDDARHLELYRLPYVDYDDD